MKKLLLFAVLLGSVTLVAQRQDPRDTAVRAAQSFVTTRLASLSAGSTLEVGDVIVDDIGQAHVRYQHLYQGVPVFESEAIVHVDLQTESIIDATDALLVFGAVNTTPGLGANQAHGRALGYFGLTPGVGGRDDLMVVVQDGTGWLAWRANVVGDDARGPIDKVAFVDAHGGLVLRAWDNLHTAEAAQGAKNGARGGGGKGGGGSTGGGGTPTAADGTGNGFFNGTVGLSTALSSGVYSLEDLTRGGQLTCDMKNRQVTCYSMTDSDNAWGDSTLSDRQTVAVDAQYGTAVTWDYYKNVHGRTGIDDAGKGAANRVHYGNRYNNAFWSDSCYCMTYGDGDGVTFNPFDSLDVAGHEMSHGVTSRTANLTYSGESGGLNEGTSDIFGTMVEYYASNPNDPGDYYIGEKLFKSGNYALRSMIKPSADGASADCWYSGLGSLNVHYSSGVANHFYYLLAEGTNGISPTCAAGDTRIASGTGTLSGIGRDKAAKIWYRALTVYMTSSTNYAAARIATHKAAADLVGTIGDVTAQVDAAWSAVNVN